MSKLKLISSTLQFASVVATPYVGINQLTPDEAYKLFLIRLNADEKQTMKTIMKDPHIASTFKLMLAQTIKNDPFTDAFNEIKKEITILKDDALVALTLKLKRSPTLIEKANIYKDQTFLNSVKNLVKTFSPKSSTFLTSFRNDIENNLRAALMAFKIPITQNLNIPQVIGNIISQLKQNPVLFTPFATKPEFSDAFNTEFAKQINSQMIQQLFQKQLEKLANEAKDEAVNNGLSIVTINQQIDAKFNSMTTQLQQIINQYKITKSPSTTFSDIANILVNEFKTPLKLSLDKIAQAIQAITPVGITNDNTINSVSSVSLKSLFPNWDTVGNGILKGISRKNIVVKVVKHNKKSAIISVNLVDNNNKPLTSKNKLIEKNVTIPLDGKINEAIAALKKMLPTFPVLWNFKVLDNINTLKDLESVFQNLNNIIKKYPSLDITIEKVSNLTLERIYKIKVTDKTDPNNFKIIDKTLQAPAFVNNLDKALNEIKNSINGQSAIESRIKVGPLNSAAEIQKIFSGNYEEVALIIRKYQDIGFNSAKIEKINGRYELTVELESKTLTKYGPKPATKSKTIILKNIKSVYDEFIKKVSELNQPNNNNSSNKPYKSWNKLNLEKLEYIFTGLKQLINQMKQNPGFTVPNITGVLNPRTGSLTMDVIGKKINKKVIVSNFDTEQQRFMSELFQHLSTDNTGLNQILNYPANKVLNRQEIENLFPWISRELSIGFKFIKPQIKILSSNAISKTIDAEISLADKDNPTQKITRHFQMKWLKQGEIDNAHKKLLSELSKQELKLNQLQNVDPLTKNKMTKKLIALKAEFKLVQTKWNNDLGSIPNRTGNQNSLTNKQMHTKYELHKYIENQTQTLNQLTNQLQQTINQSKKWDDLAKQIKQRISGPIPKAITDKLNKSTFTNIPHLTDLFSKTATFSKVDKILLSVFGAISGVVSLILIGNLINIKRVIKRSKTMAAMTAQGKKPKVKLLSPPSIIAISVSLTILAIGATIWSLITALL